MNSEDNVLEPEILCDVIYNIVYDPDDYMTKMDISMEQMHKYIQLGKLSLLENSIGGMDINSVTGGTTMLLRAILCENVGIVRMLLKKGANPNYVINGNIQKCVPLHTSVYVGNMDIMKELIISGSNVNYQIPRYGYTALQYCIKYNRIDMYDYLIKVEGINYRTVDISGNTLLHDIILYKRNGVDISKFRDIMDKKNKKGVSCIDIAVMNNKEMIYVLLRKKVVYTKEIYKLAEQNGTLDYFRDLEERTKMVDTMFSMASRGKCIDDILERYRSKGWDLEEEINDKGIYLSKLINNNTKYNSTK